MNSRLSSPAVARGVDGAGRRLAERLGLTIIGTEGHDLKAGCVVCKSSDGPACIRIQGLILLFVRKPFNAFDLCKVVLNDHEAAKRLMIDVGPFQDLGAGSNGNGYTSPAVHQGNGKAAPMTDEKPSWKSAG